MGWEYDPETDALLLACKESAGKGYRGFKAVYAISLKTMTLHEDPWLLISLKEIEKKSGKGKFNPSGIAIHPVSKTIFIISADRESIIEMSRNGKLLSQRELPRKINSQHEGIAFAPDLSLMICNDGQGRTGTLVRYPLSQQ